MNEFNIWWDSVESFLDNETEENIALKRKYAMTGWEACRKATLKQLDETVCELGEEMTCPYAIYKKVEEM